MVAGPEGSDRPERFVPMLNAERSPTFYEFDSGEQLKVWRRHGTRDEVPVVIYHSHTATEAYPTRTDISLRRPSPTRTTCSCPPATRDRARVAQLPHRRRRGDRGSRVDGRRVSLRERPRSFRRSSEHDRLPFRSRPSCAPTPAARSASTPTGDTLPAVIDDLESNHSRLSRPAHRLTASCTASSTSTSTTRTCGSPAAWTPRSTTATR